MSHADNYRLLAEVVKSDPSFIADMTTAELFGMALEAHHVFLTNDAKPGAWIGWAEESGYITVQDGIVTVTAAGQKKAMEPARKGKNGNT